MTRETCAAMLETTRIPLDSRVLASVLEGYEGETLEVGSCDVPVYHGKGKAVFKSKFTYSGDFFKGRMHGTGRIEWSSSGVIYEGDIKYNEITGHGTYWWPNGSSYVGHVKCGKRHGYGVFETGDKGTVSMEQEENGTKREELSLPSDCCIENQSEEKSEDLLRTARYSGAWRDGVPHGYGEVVFDAVHNVRYEGQFVAGKREGHGRMYYADGSVYAGDWQANVKCGHGVMTWMTSAARLDEISKVPLEMYDGEWYNDCPHGFGRYVWYQQATQASSQSLYDQNWYQGEFQQGLRHGRGMFFYANGAHYEGEWQANTKDGYGLFFHDDGRVFVGLYAHDRTLRGSVATAPRSSSTHNDEVMLYIDDLLPFTDRRKREKARKAIGDATLRLLTELRDLYRGYIPPSRQLLPTALDDRAVSGKLLDLVDCRQLLCHCGVYVTSTELHRYVDNIRTAQRMTAVAEAVAMEIAEHFDPVRPNLQEERANNPRRLDVVPYNERILFREFVELLVRMASTWVHTAEADGFVELIACDDKPDLLATVFSGLYDQMTAERLDGPTPPHATWWTRLRAELTSKTLHWTFRKHHAQFLELYDSCKGLVVQQNLVEQDRSLLLDAAVNETKKPTVSIQSLLAMLCDTKRVKTAIFTSTFQPKDALGALTQALAPSFPPVPVERLELGVRRKDTEPTLDPDPFILGTHLVFSDFLAAFATVLFAKQHVAMADGLWDDHARPLSDLVEQFMESEKEQGSTPSH